MLQEHLPSLRALFKSYSLGEGTTSEKLNAITLMDFEEWKNLCRDFK